MGVRVLYCGDTETEVLTVHKGFDSYTLSWDLDDSDHLRAALAGSDLDGEAGDFVCEHLDAGRAHAHFPATGEDLHRYDVVIISDVGYNTLALTPGFRPPLAVPMGPNRIAALRQFVLEGGGLLMIGGWLSFSGMYGKASYGGTDIERLLPVHCTQGDDRQEVPEGFAMQPTDPDHPIVAGLPWEQSFSLLGYNRVTVADDAEVVCTGHGSPMLVCGRAGRGRTAAFMSDVAPHWAGSFCTWPGYGQFWRNLTRWLASTSQECR